MMHLERPNPARLILAVAYAVAGAGGVVIAFDTILYNRWASLVLEAVGIGILVVILLTGRAWLWLAIGGIWVYAAVMAFFRGIDYNQRLGLGLIFLALAIGALAAYVGYDRKML